MRLIDADNFIKRIFKNNDLPWNLDKITQVIFKSCVEHQPAAYDVEKVINTVNKIDFNSRTTKARVIRAIEAGGLKSGNKD